MTRIIVTEKQLKGVVGNFLNEYRSTYNNAPLVPITETTAKRMLDRHTEDGYIILSACRGGSDFGLTGEKDAEKLASINHKRTKELMNDIQSMNFSYTPVFGGFIENKGEENEENVYEQSFIIYNRYKGGDEVGMDVLMDFGKTESAKFNQDSFLYKEKGQSPKYITSSGDVDMEFGDDVTFDDFSQDYFTDLHKNSDKYKDEHDTERKSTRFSFTEAYVNPKPQCYSERVVRSKNGEIFIK